VKLVKFGLGLFVIGLSNCGTPAGSSPSLPFLHLFSKVQQIHEVQAEPSLNTTIYLHGRVGDRIPLINGLIYQLQDDTGRIWVLTSDPVLETGAEVTIKGIVRYQSIPLAGREQGEVYIEEQSREGQ